MRVMNIPNVIAKYGMRVYQRVQSAKTPQDVIDALTCMGL